MPSTYRGQDTAATRISTPDSVCVSAASSSAFISVRSSPESGVRRNVASTSWRAPWRRHQASASASRRVEDVYVSEPVSSWIPSANTVASRGVTAISRSARMPTSVVVSAPSVERTAFSGRTQSGSSPAWWSKTTFSTFGSSATGSSSPSRAACTVSTTTSRRTASSATREGSAQCSSSACSRANSRTFRLRTLGSTDVEPGYRQRAANRDPNASKSVFTWVAMISSALIGTL